MIEEHDLTTERIISGNRLEEDVELDTGLRPRRLQEFIGQESTKKTLSIFIQAANKRGEALDHVLLYGPPGLGKTCLAHIIANELGSNIHITSGPAIERQGDLVAILTNLEPRDVLFIDEIHRLSRTVEEYLYPAMEDRSIDLVIGKGPAARSIRLDINPFTLVGATTRAGMLSSPLRDRFGVVLRLDFYKTAEMERIVKRTARILDIQITDGGAREIARRSRGTPRVANRLLKRVRDYAEVEGNGTIDKATSVAALNLLEVDELGLDRMDRHVLRTVIQRFAGGPVGIEAMAAAMSEESETIEDVCEPFLLQIGYLQRTPRGRVATDAAYKHLGLTPPTTLDKLPEQEDLFREDEKQRKE